MSPPHSVSADRASGIGAYPPAVAYSVLVR